MLTDKEARDTILFLRSKGYTISGIHAVTGQTITKICEVLYFHKEENRDEQNQNDIAFDSVNSYNGVF